MAACLPGEVRTDEYRWPVSELSRDKRFISRKGLQQLTNGPVLLKRVAQRQVGYNRVPVLATRLLDVQESCIVEFPDDSHHGTFGDSDHMRNLADLDIWLLPD